MFQIHIFLLIFIKYRWHQQYIELKPNGPLDWDPSSSNPCWLIHDMDLLQLACWAQFVINRSFANWPSIQSGIVPLRRYFVVDKVLHFHHCPFWRIIVENPERQQQISFTKINQKNLFWLLHGRNCKLSWSFVCADLYMQIIYICNDNTSVAFVCSDFFMWGVNETIFTPPQV